ncbi:MAG: hypothetical protein Q4A01_08700 [Coriobacteriales bacterium]|nr:hypothetical protein [Coriobacteriales bacterium]
MAAKRPTTFSMRMPEDLNERIQAYATEHSCTKAEAMSHFARAGIELEDAGPAQAQGSDETLKSIQERLDALKNLPTIEPAPTTAIVPADIRDKIQTYSAEHDCTDQEALAYYARIGIQMSEEQRPASVGDLNELSRRLDALAKDNQAKTDQIKQMAEVLVEVRDYTKPEELELEGEIAEDVEEPELTDEERQRIADEHTRQIVTDVMGDYLAKQQEADEQWAAAQRGAINPWIPVLVAIIVSLLIGLVLVLTR